MFGQSHPNINTVKRNGMTIISVLYGKEGRSKGKTNNKKTSRIRRKLLYTIE